MSANLVQHNEDERAKRECLTVEGTVQGVGFRPFVYRLAQEFGLSGYVQNTPAGVIIEIEGASSPLEAFKKALKERKPPHARILSLDNTPLTTDGGYEFVIRPSEAGEEEPTALMLPDLAVCADCLREMNDPADRRHNYPFINCTNCGPRFSIITALPYNRLNTTMAGFDMCDACRAEYHNPEDRRHHAQPIACADCGPQLQLRNAKGKLMAQRNKALQKAAQAVRDGKILALKGLGGFHLVCDSSNEDAVVELRRRKHRPIKPFALMYPSLQAVRSDCMVIAEEEKLLTSAESPIVLLRKMNSSGIAENIAPGNPNLGVMLPYTPLHHLLISKLDFPVVATSGNHADEPICIDEDEAVETLQDIADLFLVHDRPISGRCDDSILRVMAGRATVLRRARGYAPLPVIVHHKFAVPVLGAGGHLKNTVALAVRDRVFLSPHIGDLDTPKACAAHREAADQLCRLYKAAPENVVHDLHPDYRSTQMAQAHGGNVIAVQHHHAHALACMAENGVKPPCLAVTWDGSGYGTDNTIWGGEFLKIEPGGYDRVLHFLPFPLPGGDAAVLDPKRTALGMLYALKGDEAFNSDIGLPAEDAWLMKSALKKNINCPLTSSVGRIFDVVAALTGVCADNTFEGQAAMALEFAAGPDAIGVYEFRIDKGVIDWRPMLREILDDIENSVAPSVVSAKFHTTLATVIVGAANHIGEETVLLTGGCFQNALLLEYAVDALELAGFMVHTHRQVPPNDGGLALGQVMAMAHTL
ncbi:MAG: carbamoyltransferase [marine bacterium B5-7]|nr:MAG: carbamoyltransferase [marine bacterium B5-7]